MSQQTIIEYLKEKREAVLNFKPSEKEIKIFLNKWGTKSSNSEDESIVELMMDDHIHIIYENQGYYINENIDEEDELMYDYLRNNYESTKDN